MAWVWLSLGSNIDRSEHIRGAVRDLRAGDPQLVLSSVYESDPVGFVGPPFYNLVAGMETGQEPVQVVRFLRGIEDAHGRDRAGGKFSARTLDIDLLTYGDHVIAQPGLAIPRDEITRYAFVLRPLAEVAPNQRHPVLDQTYRDLWDAFDQAAQRVTPVDFCFD